MPYKTFWYVDKRVLCTQLYGDVSNEEFFRDVAEIQTLSKEGTPPIFMVVDFLASPKLSMNVRELLQGLNQHRDPDSKNNWTIILSPNAIFNFFSMTAAKVMNAPMRVFKTQSEADAFIRHNAPEIVLPKNVEGER